ncbi:MAG: hypothetical protein HDT28_04305, partial [Clostridiales bacterium]|nr:hypothetical protein [Clostridiales bacterium]
MPYGFVTNEYLNGINEIWEYITSGIAILIYAIVIIALVALLIVSVLVADSRSKIIIDKKVGDAEATDKPDSAPEDLLKDGDEEADEQEQVNETGERFPSLLKIDE